MNKTPGRNLAAMVVSAVLAGFLSAPAIAAARPQAAGPAARVLSVRWDPSTGKALVFNGRLELVIETKSGLNPRSLRDTRSGRVFADRDYSWPGGAFPALAGGPVVADLPGGGRSITFRGTLGPIAVEQTFAAPMAEPGVITEKIVLRNPGREPLPTADFKCGFAKLVREGEKWSTDAADPFCPIPYRRETNGKMQEFPLREIVERGMPYQGWAEEPVVTPAWGSEGWVWSGDKASLLLSKYNPEAMEWSLMEPEKRGAATVIRFGGAGLWKHDHPEGAARLDPGETLAFGETRLQAVEGDWKQAFYAYRSHMERLGCRTRPDYDPPVHWNELYDNEYYFKCCQAAEQFVSEDKSELKREFFPINDRLLKEYYTLDLMLGEAAKARELGCEALYLDPGWDTGTNQQVWDAARLGPMDGFVRRMKEEYGLKVSLWNALGNVPPSYGDPEAGPPESRVLAADGKRAPIFCFSSPAFLDLKEKRLLEVCRNGASFLMFDSNQFSGPCFDKSHGHAVPSTREEHAGALLELIRRVKARYPRVLIELHDPISGPSGIHYTPTYYGYGRPDSFDCLWGHEFMWDPLEDILSLRATSLYYYNLSYSIPLYLHVNLKKDNENSLIFWWFASLCRHLGVGGKPGPAVWEAEKRAMRTYKPLKEFYTRGIFYGIEETVHVHTLFDRQEAVINVFNLGDKPERKIIRFLPADIGLPPGACAVEGVPTVRDGEAVTITLDLPPRSHRLLKAGRPAM